MKLFPKTSGWFGGLFAVAFCLLSLSGAKAQLLWYNGDAGTGGSADNIFATASTDYTGIVYQDFTVTDAGGWQVTGVSGTFLLPNPVTTANWVILSGVSEGNGGNLVASGTASPLTLNELAGPNSKGNTLYQASVTGLNFDLAAGTYWLGLQPISSGFGYIVNTTGQNAIGASTGAAYYTETGLGGIPIAGPFTSTAAIKSDLANFSMGISGTVSVPEPSSSKLLLIALGSLAVSVYLRKRLARV